VVSLSVVSLTFGSANILVLEDEEEKALARCCNRPGAKFSGVGVNEVPENASTGLNRNVTRTVQSSRFEPTPAPFVLRWAAIATEGFFPSDSAERIRDITASRWELGRYQVCALEREHAIVVCKRGSLVLISLFQEFDREYREQLTDVLLQTTQQQRNARTW
jgi:hypothetical protein